MTKKHSNVRKIFIFLFSIVVLIDSINGFILNQLNINLSVGQLFRVVLFFILLAIIIKYSKKGLFKVIFIILYFLIMQLIYFYYHSSIKGLLLDINESFKPLLIIVIIEAYKALNRHGIINKKDIATILKINLVLFPLSIIVPKMLGLGEYVYSNGSGYKAFYNANNDLNIVLLVLLIFGIDQLFKVITGKGKSLFYLLFVFLLLVTLLLIGSKSSIVFSIVIILFYLLKSLVKNTFVTNFKIGVSTFVVITAVTYLLSNYYQDDVDLILERQTYFYESNMQDDNNIIAFLLSGRNEFLNAAVLSFEKSEFKVPRMLIGTGKYYHSVLTGKEFSRDSLIIEMDLFDIFFSYGILGLLIIYGYFTSIFVRYLTSTSKGKELSYILSYIVIAIFSFLGGHVFFSALSGTFLALVCCLLLSCQNEKTDKNTSAL
ncbi:hypothetical protein ASE51_17640 [Bacillus sp. Root147]|nr:hypothetical protein ASE51_17640 [Bacillus sp. Root147]